MFVDKAFPKRSKGDRNQTKRDRKSTKMGSQIDENGRMEENGTKMTPKTRQGGAPKALENQVEKKNVQGRKNYCNFW